MWAMTTCVFSKSTTSISGRTGGVSLSEQMVASESAVALARKPGAGMKPFFSERPRTMVPPGPFENAETVSAMEAGSFCTDSLTSMSCVSVATARRSRTI